MDVVADEEDADALGLELLDELADLRRLRGPSAAVGSSMIRMRALKWIARAMATDWRWPPESAVTGSLKRRKLGLRRPITLRASASIEASSSVPQRVRSSRPR